MRTEYNVITGEVLTFPDEQAVPVEEGVIVPQEISKAQGIAVMAEYPLGESTLWLEVKAYFETTASETERDLFNAVTVFNRQSPMLNALKGAFGLTDEMLDQLFILGSQKVI